MKFYIISLGLLGLATLGTGLPAGSATQATAEPNHTRDVVQKGGILDAVAGAIGGIIKTKMPEDDKPAVTTIPPITTIDEDPLLAGLSNITASSSRNPSLVIRAAAATMLTRTASPFTEEIITISANSKGEWMCPDFPVGMPVGMPGGNLQMKVAPAWLNGDASPFLMAMADVALPDCT